MASKKPPQPPEEASEDLRDDRTASMFGDEPSAGGGSSGGPAAYQVLARKYRPLTFEDLAGQEAMVRTLTNAFKTGRIAHAFMLTGVRGVGKTTTARLLARALNYKTDKKDGPSIHLDPPGVHCASIMASTHPDVLELDAASHTGVSDMRDLLDGARYAPVNARYKVYIIDEVHMLSTAAFNALLKTLEEPPPHVKFIFATTEIRKVPVTVLSRCQRFNLQRFSTEALAEHLTKIVAKEGAKAAPDALALIARAAEGSARDALSILDQAIVQGEASVTAEAVRDMLGLADRSRVLDLLDKIVSADNRAALVEAEALLEAGADATVLVKDLMDAVVEVSRAQALKEAYTFAGPADWGKRTVEMAGKISAAQSARMWKLLLQGFEDCARAPDPPAAAQMVVLRLAAAAALPSPEDAARMMAGGGAASSAAASSGSASSSSGSGGGSQVKAGGREMAATSRGHDGPTMLAVRHEVVHAVHEEEHHGVRMSSLREIVVELDAQRQIDLRYEIERYVRPAEIDFGHFRYTAAPGAPHDLSAKIKSWLETTSGVEWDVAQSNDGAAESTVEKRVRKAREKLENAAAHPRIAAALKAFPGAKVLRVDGDDAPDDDDDAPPSSNVIHVDFAAREAARELAVESIPIDPEAEEDDA